MENKTNFEKFCENLESPYDVFVAICATQFKNLIEAKEYDKANMRLELIKECIQQQLCTQK